MTWLAKITGGTIAAFVMAMLLLALGAAHYVRSAVDQGALTMVATCISTGDAEKLDGPQASRIEDYFFIWQVLSYYYGDDIPGPSMGWRGALIQLGSRFAYDAEERNALTKRHFLAKPDCPRRFRTLPEL